MADPKTPRFVQTWLADDDAARDAARAALLASPASVAPKFFYDRLGSHLFEAITELPEYYPTRTEAAIFARHGAEMAAAIGTRIALIDLGAGNCAKAARLFALLEPKRYVAVDISVDFLRDALRTLQREQPHIAMAGLGQDFSSSLDIPVDLVGDDRPVFFYPGSSIGNFEAADALAFLRRVRARAAGGGLLIGVDLVKPKAILEAAYDDSLGVTAAFNRNLLVRANREAAANFDLTRFAHYAPYNVEKRRIEMYLVSTAAQLVRVAGRQIAFAEGEAIHTESSHKYTIEDFRSLAVQAGFSPRAVWTDPDRLFSIHWLEA